MLESRSGQITARSYAPRPPSEQFLPRPAAVAAGSDPSTVVSRSQLVDNELDAGRCRVAHWREQEGASVSVQDREDHSGLNVIEILHRGRER